MYESTLRCFEAGVEHDTLGLHGNCLSDQCKISGSIIKSRLHSIKSLFLQRAFIASVVGLNIASKSSVGRTTWGPMLRRHIIDTNFAVDVKYQEHVIGPHDCPQSGCQLLEGSRPYDRGSVVYQEYGGYSGDDVASRPRKCCHGKGRLYDDRCPYLAYCFAHAVRDLRTGSPKPCPMSRALYGDPELGRHVQKKERREPKEGLSTGSGGTYLPDVMWQQ